MNIAIIGAGIGGLASAIRLARAGYRVTVLERNDHPGGKLGELRTQGFRFDTGPSLFTLPQLAEELFSLCGEEMKQYIPYRKLTTGCKYFFPDGSEFVFYDDKEELAREVRRKTAECPEALFRRLEKARRMYELGAPVFLFSNFHRLGNFRKPEYRHVGLQLSKLDLARTMHGANRRDFSDERLVRIFDRYATYNGSDPYRAPATLNMIAHLENNLGAWFPEKGMYALVQGLCELARRQGVTFRMNTPVQEIVTDGKTVSGLRIDGTVQPFDAVVSDADARYVSEKLLAGHPLAGRLRKREPSTSAVIFYWGIRGEFPRWDVHNILFSRDYRREFRALFHDRRLPEDPTIYVFVSAKINPEDAPAGCENWFVMVNAPADCGQDWPTDVQRLRHHLLQRLKEKTGTDIDSCIVTESVATPVTIGEQTGSWGGALYGTSSNSALAAFLRHPNHLNKYDNLYFVGGSVHPGGGIPLCLASAKIATDELAQRYPTR